MTDKNGYGKNILKSVHASLRYGQYFNGFWLAVFYFLIVMGVGMILLSIVVSILMSLGLEKYDNDSVVILIATSVIGAFGIIVALCFLIKNGRLKKHILLCLNDAVMLQATTRVLDSFRTYGHPVAETKLMVEFFYDGKIIRRESGDKTKKDHWYKRNGYFKILSKYANRTVNILYSPSHDSVFILKDKVMGQVKK